jgi:predicted amidohydrolase YtcJ
MAADLILYNGRVITLAVDGAAAQAVAIQDGKLVAVGDSSTVRALAGPHTKQLSLDGATVIPGLCDSHNHLLNTGFGMGRVQLAAARSLDDVLQAVRARAAELRAGEWVVASGGWHETALREQRLPTAQELDRVAPAHPVYIPRGGHVVVVNSHALRLAGITEDTAPPERGVIGRNPADGTLDGLLMERPVFERVERLLPTVRHEDRMSAISRAAKAYVAAGWTSVRDPGLHPVEMQAYQDLRANDGLPLRVLMALRLEARTQPVAEILDMLHREEPHTGVGDEFLRVGTTGITVDGGVETGYFRDGYATDPSFHGVLSIPEDELEPIIRLAHAYGWQVAAGVVGDAAMDVLLDVYERVNAASSIVGRRFLVEYAFQPSPESFVRARRLGLVITMQHPLVYALGGNMLKYWGPERANRCSPVRDWLAHGLAVAGGTDSQVGPYQPLLAIWGLVTRQTNVAGVLGPDQRVSREQALRLYTINTAYMSFEEHLKGSIEPGKLADLVVLADDILTCPEDDIKDLKVLMTVVGGQIVHEA